MEELDNKAKEQFSNEIKFIKKLRSKGKEKEKKLLKEE